MNKQKLWAAEKAFLRQYPAGPEDPGLKEIIKKHRPEKMHKLAQEIFEESNFSFPARVAEGWLKLVNASSMISIFDKPKFRDFMKSMNEAEVSALVKGLYEFLYGEEAFGFDAFVEQLRRGRMAKWSIVTVGPVYLRPQQEVFVKPTTAKGIIEYFEVSGLTYHPQPTYAFYKGFRDLILEMKSLMRGPVSDNNAAFTGFLMMKLEGYLD